MKKKDSNINYHLGELEIARDRTSPFRIMPQFSENDHAILDIGCGIGQTFAALEELKGRSRLVGLDIDMESLAYGRDHFNFIKYTNGAAEYLPFKNNAFDAVICRVSLPYTNIPKALVEIRRVLKDDREVWFTLHSLSMELRQLRNSIRSLRLRRVIFGIYVIVNGLIFHFFGKQFSFPTTNRCASFQTESGMIRALNRTGYTNAMSERKGIHFIVTAKKKPQES